MTVGTVPQPPGKTRRIFSEAAALVFMAGVALLGGALLDSMLAVAFAGLASVAGWAIGYCMGRDNQMRATRQRLYWLADELVQYRGFTQLLRSQNERIVDASGDAALVIANGLREMDERVARVVAAIDAAVATGKDHAEWGQLRREAAAITQPVMEMVGKLQFQDVTRQQLEFLSRLSLILDEHMADLARMLGDRRSLDRTTRFKELFDQALDDTVMTSQRNDHHSAGGLQLFESTGPTVEMFTGEGESR